MSSSFDSDSDTYKDKSFRIGLSATPVHWNGDDWTFYKHAMINDFEDSLLDQIAIGKETLDDSWDDDRKGFLKEKSFIQGQLLMNLAKQVMMKATGTEMWS